MEHDSLKGQLLIAAPMLLDPNFRRTVVLLLEHTPEGAIGVVLNRPSDTEAREAVPDRVVPAKAGERKGRLSRWAFLYD